MHFFTKLGISIAAAATILIATAQGQEAPPLAQCGPRSGMLEALAKQYHEIPALRGLGDDGVLYEILISPDGETWTIVGTRLGPQGMITCVKAAGQKWDAYPAPEKGA